MKRSPPKRRYEDYVTEDIILPSSHQTEVPVRISHQSSRDRPFVGIVANQKISGLRHAFNARGLMPAKFTELKTPVVNLDERSQTLPKGTKLEVLEQLDEGRGCHSPSESQEPMTDFVQKKENLPDEVSSQVREIPCEEGHCQIGLKRKQEEDPVLGDIVRLRRSRDEVPSQE